MGTNYFINPPLGWRGLGNPTDRSEFPDNPIYNVGEVLPLHWITNYTQSTCFLFQDFPRNRRIGERIFGPARRTDDGHQRFNWTINTGRFSLADSNVFFLVVSSENQDLIYSHYFNLSRARGLPESTTPNGETTILPIPDGPEGAMNGIGGAPPSGLGLPVVLGLVGGILVGLSVLLLAGYFFFRSYRAKRSATSKDYMETRRSRIVDRTEDPEARGPEPDPERNRTVVTSNRSDNRSELGSFHFDFEKPTGFEAGVSSNNNRNPSRSESRNEDERFAGFRVFTKASGRVKELGMKDQPSNGSE